MRSYSEAKEILTVYRSTLERVAEELLRVESLDGRSFYEMIGKPLPERKAVVLGEQPSPAESAMMRMERPESL